MALCSGVWCFMALCSGLWCLIIWRYVVVCGVLSYGVMQWFVVFYYMALCSDLWCFMALCSGL